MFMINYWSLSSTHEVCKRKLVLLKFKSPASYSVFSVPHKSDSADSVSGFRFFIFRKIPVQDLSNILDQTLIY